MELQFDRKELNCLQLLTSRVQNQELTQEVRLPDGMPDIGRVLGAWAQVLVRSKEWRDDSIRISGGAMAWVLYSPEGEGAPCWVEAWLPFQMKWELPKPSVTVRSASCRWCTALTAAPLQHVN